MGRTMEGTNRSTIRERERIGKETEKSERSESERLKLMRDHYKRRKRTVTREEIEPLPNFSNQFSLGLASLVRVLIRVVKA